VLVRFSESEEAAREGHRGHKERDMNLLPVLLWLSARLPNPRVIRSRDGLAYLTRWYLWGAPKVPADFVSPFDEYGNPIPEAVWADGIGVYLHRVHRSDDELALHNHPWMWARAIILHGGYLEERRTRWDIVRGYRRRPGDVVELDAGTFHRVQLAKCGCRVCVSVPEAERADVESWSLFVCGPKHGRSWGFWDRDTGVFLPWREFIAKARSGS
jgi:hypothetical protein